jgi:hypothetical protein
MKVQLSLPEREGYACWMTLDLQKVATKCPTVISYPAWATSKCCVDRELSNAIAAVPCRAFGSPFLRFLR